MGIETREAHPGETRRRSQAASARLWLAVAVVSRSAPPSTRRSLRRRAGATGARQARRWQAWLADERACPGGGSTTARIPRTGMTMLCLVNYARARQGLGRSADPRPELERRREGGGHRPLPRLQTRRLRQPGRPGRPRARLPRPVGREPLHGQRPPCSHHARPSRPGSTRPATARLCSGRSFAPPASPSSPAQPRDATAAASATA